VSGSFSSLASPFRSAIARQLQPAVNGLQHSAPRAAAELPSGARLRVVVKAVKPHHGVVILKPVPW